MSNPKPIIFSEDIFPLVLSLTNEEAGKLFMAILEYYENGTTPDTDDRVLMMAFVTVRQSIDANLAKMEDISRKRSEAGKKGNEVRWGKNRKKSQRIAKIANNRKASQSIAKIANAINVGTTDNEVFTEISEENGKNTDSEETVFIDSETQETTEKKEFPPYSPPKENTPIPLKEIYPPIIPQEKKTKTRACVRVTAEPLDGRRDKFYKSLIPFLPDYGKDMIRAFYDYWSEYNRSKTKMRWEMEKTWELSKRIAYWNSRTLKYRNNENHNTGTPEDRAREVELIIQRLAAEE